MLGTSVQPRTGLRARLHGALHDDDPSHDRARRRYRPGVLVKAQLSKAVDGAALGAARMMNSGNPKGEATRIFNANFLPGLSRHGNRRRIQTAASDFFNSADRFRQPASTSVTVTAKATLPTTFMQLAQHQRRHRQRARARRRGGWSTSRSSSTSRARSAGGGPPVRDAARTFVDSFDAASDRMSRSSPTATARR